MQINITQYVLVRIPKNMHLFDENQEGKALHLMGTGLRTSLLAKGSSVNDDQEDWSPSKGTSGMSLGQLLQKIRESQKDRDDNFTA
jgi:hypothetical protein